MYAAENAKFCSKIFLFVIVLLNLVIIAVSASLFQFGILLELANNSTDFTDWRKFDIASVNVDFSHIQDWRPSSYLAVLLIILTLGQTLVVGLFRHHNPNQRWQTQRTMAMKMWKIIWTFRTRTGPFDVPRDVIADDILEMKLNQWRGATGNGTDLVSSTPMNLLRKTVFRHDQYTVLCKRASDHRSLLIEYQLANCGLCDLPPKLHKFTNKVQFQETSHQDYDDEASQSCWCRWCCCRGNSSTEATYSMGYDDDEASRQSRWCRWCCCRGNSSTEATYRMGYDKWNKLVKSTKWSLYSVYNHYESMRCASLEDDHFSPMTGRQYVTHRIIPTLRFYEGQMPKNLRRHNIFAYSIGFMTMAASFCAVFSIPPSSQFWVAIITASLSCIHGFERFYNPSKNLVRYKTAVSEMKKLLAFWEGLGPLRENKSFNNSRLVELGEQIILDVSSELCTLLS